MKLKKLEVNSFGGIHPQSPVVIDFTQSKHIIVDGNNGSGKTSLLTALLVACGHTGHTGKQGKDFINNDSGKIDIDFEFVGNDRLTYRVRCTKSSFSLTYEGESVPEPLTKMKELLGVVGVSPMEIKNRPLKEIVKWLSAYSVKGADLLEDQFTKIKDGIKKYAAARADANRSLKGIKEYLESDHLYINWEDSEKKYTKQVDIKELSERRNTAGVNSDKYIRAEAKIKQLKEARPAIVNEIERLEAQLVEKKELLKDQDKSITTGEKFLTDNKSFKTEYDKVMAEYDSAAKDVVSYNNWQDIKNKKKEMDGYETLSQRADASEKELLQELKDLQAEILPDVKGVELITEDTMEEGVIKKEGLYYQGKNVAQLSESEFWSLVMLIWKKLKVKIVVIDNYQSLGTLAVDTLEKLSKDGAYILCAEMNRKQEDLQVHYE